MGALKTPSRTVVRGLWVTPEGSACDARTPGLDRQHPDFDRSAAQLDTRTPSITCPRTRGAADRGDYPIGCR